MKAVGQSQSLIFVYNEHQGNRKGEKGTFQRHAKHKANDGEYRDIAHPNNTATRENNQNMILEKYKTEK